MDVIGMTNIPEAKLAREAEICYGTIALTTDYDCWHETEESVTVDMILSTLGKNVTTAREIIKNAVGSITGPRECKCATALEYALVTDRGLIPKERKKDLELLIGKYLK